MKDKIKTVALTSLAWIAAGLIAVLCLYIQRTSYAQGRLQGIAETRQTISIAQAK